MACVTEKTLNKPQINKEQRKKKGSNRIAHPELSVVRMIH
jgi:hypothetical protein